jgi:hypothetical protein
LKKIFSIAFIALLLFNVLGYYGLFMGLRYHNDIGMIEKFDEATYNVSDEVVIKIPISIPYAIESEDFIRVDGIFEFQGEFFRKVKQRLLQDTLEIICVKDHELAHINHTWTSYVKTFTDSQKDPTHTKLHFTFSKDYLTRAFSILPSSAGWEYEVLRLPNFCFLVSDFYPAIVHPPERV